MTVWQIGNRRHAVTTEVMWDRGHVVYRLDGVGAFTILRSEYASDTKHKLHIAYGVYTEHNYRHDDREPRPEAPVINGITIVGAASFSEATFTDPDYRQSWYWPARREGGGSAPIRTGQRVEDICRAITLDYLARDDLAKIEHTRAVYLAPERLRRHRERLAELRGQIADLQTELAAELAAADMQAALTRPDIPAMVDAT